MSATATKKAPPKKSAARYLVASEYIAAARNGRVDRYVATARWEFIKALHRTTLHFFERLRDHVYPKFTEADRWAAPLARWAQEYHVDAAPWILEGAQITLSRWRRLGTAKIDLDYLQGFRTLVAEDGMAGSSYDERKFDFSDAGWDPLLISFAGWRESVLTQIRNELCAYEKRVREIAHQRGLVKVPICSKEHFEWLALFQCGKLSLEDVRLRYALGADTISKGLHTAADLIGLVVRTNRAPRRKSKLR